MDQLDRLTFKYRLVTVNRKKNDFLLITPLLRLKNVTYFRVILVIYCSSYPERFIKKNLEYMTLFVLQKIE